MYIVHRYDLTIERHQAMGLYLSPYSSDVRTDRGDEVTAQAHTGHHRTGLSGPVAGPTGYGQGRAHDLSHLGTLKSAGDLSDQSVDQFPEAR
jgi:hypothetical protein